MKNETQIVNLYRSPSHLRVTAVQTNQRLFFFRFSKEIRSRVSTALLLMKKDGFTNTAHVLHLIGDPNRGEYVTGYVHKMGE